MCQNFSLQYLYLYINTEYTRITLVIGNTATDSTHPPPPHSASFFQGSLKLSVQAEDSSALQTFKDLRWWGHIASSTSLRIQSRKAGLTNRFISLKAYQILKQRTAIYSTIRKDFTTLKSSQSLHPPSRQPWAKQPNYLVYFTKWYARNVRLLIFDWPAQYVGGRCHIALWQKFSQVLLFCQTAPHIFVWALCIGLQWLQKKNKCKEKTAFLQSHTGCFRSSISPPLMSCCV